MISKSVSDGGLDGKRGKQMIERLTDRAQVALIDFKLELQPVDSPCFVDRFSVHPDGALAIAGEEDRYLTFHGCQAGRALERLNEFLRLREEGREFLRSEASPEASLKATRDNFKFAINPVGVPFVEQTRLTSG